jgi:UPF0271 protein
MRKITINCDVGEGIGNEHELMHYIQSCNIACGGHAGNEQIMTRVVQLAIKNKVKIGAHPSYPDIANFGRKTIKITSEELRKSIQNQINTLVEIIKSNNGTLNHIKPHGALYNDIAKDKKLSLIFLEAISRFKEEVKIYVPYKSVIAEKALKNGFRIEYEAFADRNYNTDLSLVSRNEKNAVIHSSTEIIKHISEMLENEVVTTISGIKVPIKADTFCVHSDTENATEIVKSIHKFYI